MTPENKKILADIIAQEIADKCSDKQVVNLEISIAINLKRNGEVQRPKCRNCKYSEFGKYQQRGTCRLTKNTIFSKEEKCEYYERI